MDNVYYIASKVLWFVFQPINFLLLSLVIGSFALFTKRRVFGRSVVFCCTAILAIIAFTPIGIHSVDTIENRFPLPELPKRIDGILVLGGGIEWPVSKGRGSLELGNAGDRIVQSVVLARKYPNAMYVYSGHQGRTLEGEIGETPDIRNLLADLGIELDRVLIESNARNTVENVRYTFDLVKPEPEEVWLVVTSSFHMSRAIAIFEQKNWDVIPWPVDFRSPGAEGHYLFFYDTPGSLSNVNIAFKEWVGSVANRYAN